MAVLTSSATPEWTTSSDQAGYEVSNLGDGGISVDSGWRWASAGGAPLPIWVQRDLGTAQTADYYVVAPGLYGSDQDPTAWELRGSNDDFATYDVLDSQTGFSFAGQPHRIPIATPAPYRLYRLHITANAGDSTTSLSELQLGGGSVHTLFDGFGATPEAASGTNCLGITFSPTEDGVVTHLIYYEVAGTTGTTTLKLFNADGTVIAATVHTATGTSGLRSIALPSPVPVIAGQNYMVTSDTYTRFARWTLPSAGLNVDYIFGSLRVPRDGTANVGGYTGNGRYGNVGEQPNNTYLASPYAISVTYVAATESDTSAPPILGDAVTDLAVGPDVADAAYIGATQIWPSVAPPEPSLADIPGRIMHLRAKDTVGDTGALITSWVDAKSSLPYIHVNAYPLARPTDTPNGGRAARFDAAYLRPSVTNLMFTDVEVLALTASSQFNSGYPPSSVAGRYGDWATSGFNSPEWFRLHLRNPTIITEYKLYSDLGGRSPAAWTFRGSHDGVNWDVLDSQTTSPSGLQTYPVTNSTAYEWYELTFTAIAGGDLLYMRRIDIGALNFSGRPLATAECWMVLRSLGAGSGHPVAVGGGDTRYPFSDGYIYSAFGGGRISYAPTMAIDTWRIYRMRYVAGIHTEWLDGVQQISASVGGPSWTTDGPAIGTGNNVPCYMDLAELIIFNHPLSASEVTLVTDHLTAEHFT